MQTFLQFDSGTDVVDDESGLSDQITKQAVLGRRLHLLAAVDADRIAHHNATPLTDILGVVETIAGPVFGFSIVALAVVGGFTRTLGNRVTAVLGVVGGVPYGIATATILFTDKTDFLFPVSAGIGLWAMAAGIGFSSARDPRGWTLVLLSRASPVGNSRTSPPAKKHTSIDSTDDEMRYRESQRRSGLDATAAATRLARAGHGRSQRTPDVERRLRWSITSVRGGMSQVPRPAGRL